MENNTFTRKMDELWRFLSDPNNLDTIINTCMKSPNLSFKKKYNLHTANEIKCLMLINPYFYIEVLYAYFILCTDELCISYPYSKITFQVEKEDLNRLLSETDGKLLWSSQIECRCKAQGLDEIIFLPAMYLSKIGLINSGIEFIDENGKTVKIGDIIINDLQKLNELGNRDISEHEPNRARAIEKYFGALFPDRLNYDNDVESNYARQFYEDLKALSEYVPAIKRSGSMGNITRDNLYRVIMSDFGLAKFYYIYKKYFIWKYQYENQIRPRPITSISFITYQDIIDAIAPNQKLKRGLANRDIYNSIYGNSLDPNQVSGKASADNISLGTFVGFASGNSDYADELYTLLLVNSSINKEQLPMLGFIWRSHLWSNACQIKALSNMELSEKCFYFLSEKIARVYEIKNDNMYLSNKTFFHCLTHFFLYHTNKHGRLISELRQAIINSLDIKKVPNEKAIVSLVTEIDKDPDLFIPIFQPVIEKVKDKQRWLQHLSLIYNGKSEVSRQVKEVLLHFIYGSSFTQEQEKEMDRNIKSISPFLCLYPEWEQINHITKANWVYSACLGLYFICIILPALNQKLNLKLKTLNSYEKNTNSSKKSIETLLKSTHIGLNSGYYHIIQGKVSTNSPYRVIPLTPLLSVINIENYNSIMDLPVPLIGGNGKEKDLSLIRSIVIFEIVLTFGNMYSGHRPDWATPEGLDNLKRLNVKLKDGDSFAFKDVSELLK